MTQDPSAPPSAQITDASAVGSTLRVDPNVYRACQLMWWSFGAGVIGMVLDLVNIPNVFLAWGTVTVIGIVFSAIAYAIVSWCASNLRAGRNWMRLLITAVNVVGLLAIPLMWDWYRDYFLQKLANPPAAVASAGQSLLGVYAVVLINTRSARIWFRTMKQGTAHDA